MRQPLRSSSFGKRALAEFDVAAGCVVDPARLSEIRRAHAGKRERHRLLDRLFDGVGELGSARREELDSVVVEGIVRRADHDARREAQRARQVGDRRRGQRSGKIDVDARRRKACLQRGLEEIARDPRVLADQHGGARTCAGRFRREDPAGGPAEPEYRLGRDRRLADATADAVGAEILSGHRLSPAGPEFRIVAIQRRRAPPPARPSARRPSRARRGRARSTRRVRRRPGWRRGSRAIARPQGVP